MNKVSFYLHNNNDSSEIRHNLREDEIPERLVDPLTEELRSFFYEVEFAVTYDDNGKITNVEMVKDE